MMAMEWLASGEPRSTGHGIGVLLVRGLAAVFVPLAIVRKRRKASFAVLDGFEIGVRRREHLLTRSLVGIGNVSEKAGSGGDQILHPIRPHIAGEDVLDLRDLTVNHLQAQRNDQRLVQLLHDAVKRYLAGGRIDRVDFESSRRFRSVHPEAISDLDSAVFSVNRTPGDSGRPEGSCRTNAARY
jgi:hypothetical protein